MRHGQGTGIGNVTVSKTELIAILYKNKASHRDAFEKALDGFREQALKKLEAVIAEVRAGRTPAFWDLVHALPVPEEHTADYDRAIRMLTMHQGNDIVLSEQAYARMVDDDWDWQQQFATTNAAYIN